MSYGIDKNTVLCLRGDSLQDLSLSPKTITNTSVSVSDGRLRFSGVTSYFKATGLDFNALLAGDFTIEYSFYMTERIVTYPTSYSIAAGTDRFTYVHECAGGTTYVFHPTSGTNMTGSAPEFALNTWKHIAIVKKSGNATIYIDGVKTVGPIALTNLKTTGATEIYFGRLNSSDSATQFTGYMKNIRVSNCARYSANYTPSATPFTSVRITNMRLLDNSFCCEVYKGSANETISKYEILLNGSVIETVSGNFSAKNITKSIDASSFVNGKNTIEVRVYYYGSTYTSRTISFHKDMHITYDFGVDENTVLFLRGDSFDDLSANPKIVTNNSTTLHSNKSFHFDANTDNITVTELVASDFDNVLAGDFTLEFEGYLLGYTTYSTPFGFMNGTNRSLYMHYPSGNVAAYFGKGATYDNCDISRGSGFPLNTWHHLAIVRRGNTGYMFIDGVCVNSRDVSTLYTDVAKLFIGTLSGETACWWNGYIRNFRFSKCARYTENFTPPSSHYHTSVSMSNIVREDDNIIFSVFKNSGFDTISKVDILVNNVLTRSLTNSYDYVSFSLDNENIIYGTNNIEIRAYYFNDKYISRTYTYKKEIALESIEVPQALDNYASHNEAIAKTTEFKNILSVIRSNLIAVLNANNITIDSSTGLIYLSNLFAQLSVTSPSDITELNNRIVELETANNNLISAQQTNILALKNALLAKNVPDIENATDMTTLINAISVFNELPKNVVLYSYGVDKTALTGGWAFGYIYTSTYGLTEKPAVQLKTDHIYLEANQGSSSCGGRVHAITRNKIDVTKYNTLRVKATLSFASSTQFMVNFNANFREGSADNFTYNAKNAATHLLLTEAAATNKVYDIDISEQTGLWHIEFQFHSWANVNKKAYIYEITLLNK